MNLRKTAGEDGAGAETMLDANLLEDTGILFLEILIILIVSAGALAAARIAMRHWLWPIFQRAQPEPDRKIFSLLGLKPGIVAGIKRSLKRFCQGQEPH